eukprot:scaffold238286_cov19-Tisochrysis_lutea.AAC.2
MLHRYWCTNGAAWTAPFVWGADGTEWARPHAPIAGAFADASGCAQEHGTSGGRNGGGQGGAAGACFFVCDNVIEDDRHGGDSVRPRRMGRRCRRTGRRCRCVLFVWGGRDGVMEEGREV